MIKGRIIKGVGGRYNVLAEDGVYSCLARGLFRVLDKGGPIVGDIVDILLTDEQNDTKTGYLNKIYDRTNELIRPKIANVDQVFIVFASVFPTINFDLLDRFIVLAEEQGLEIIICINKVDLDIDKTSLKAKEVYEKVGYKTILVSAKDNIGIDEIKNSLTNKVSIVAGPSGVGKSSIINSAFPDLKLETGELSKKIERGKHTTRHTELLILNETSFLADTPGFTLISLNNIMKENIQLYFREFSPFVGLCKFNNCLHINEPGCIIKEHVGDLINEVRYANYVRFMKE